MRQFLERATISADQVPICSLVTACLSSYHPKKNVFVSALLVWFRDSLARPHKTVLLLVGYIRTVCIEHHPRVQSDAQGQ